MQLWVTVIIFVGGVFFTALFGWLSTRSARKDMAQNTKVLGDFVRGLLEKNDVTLDVEENGRLTLSVIIKPEPIRIHVGEDIHVGENVLAILKRVKPAETQ